MNTLGEMLDTAVAGHGDRRCVALSDAAQTSWWTYRELGSRVERGAALLQAQGIEQGDRVGLWAPNSPAWVAAFFAILKAGGVVVPLDVNSRPEFVGSVLGTTRAKLLLAGDAQRARAPEAMPVLGVAEVADAPVGSLRPVALSPQDLAEVVFTSGTTSAPKGVMLSHGNITSVQQSLGQLFPCHPEHRVLSVLPLSHMFEQICGLLWPLAGGASIIYLPSLQGAAIFQAMEREHITCMAAVPQMLALFLRGIEREIDRQGRRRVFEITLKVAALLPFALRRRLFAQVHQRLGGQLDFFAVGGAYLDPELQRRWERLGVKVVQGYGATECSPTITSHTMDRHKAGSVGPAIPGVEIRLAQDGEILVRGPNVTSGYWENPEATAEAIRDGWYYTGDLGQMGRDGDLRLLGRKKNMIVLSSGLNVFPEDIEDALRRDERVSDAVVLGVPRGSEVDVHAVLLLRDGSQAPDVVRAANRRLAAHQAIRGSTVWPDADFPRTATMKVSRLAVQEAVPLAHRAER